MELRDISVNFTESAEDEVKALVKDLQLIPLASALASGNQVPDELRTQLGSLVTVLTDLFSTSLPDLETNPDETLRKVSRDINLSRLLRERGMFRLYRLVTERTSPQRQIEDHGNGYATIYDVDDGGVPLFMLTKNPDTGAPFAKQEEFIGWFCENAHVARSLTFQRFAAIERLLSLGFSLEEAFRLIVSKPYVIQETMKLVANWDKGDMKSIDPDVAVNMTRRHAPELLDYIQNLAEEAKDDPSAMDGLKAAIRPVFATMLEEVADNPRAKDAMAYVKHDIVALPEISYAWDDEANIFVAEFVRKGIDQATGQQVLLDIQRIPWVPDVDHLPEELKQDIINRLAMRNRATLKNS